MKRETGASSRRFRYNGSMICVIDGCRRDEPGGRSRIWPLLISVVAWCSTFAAVVTSDVGLLAYRELDDALGLSVLAGDRLAGCRAGKNGRHALVGLLRQSVFGRLADRTSTTPSGYVTILQCAGSSAVKLRKDALRHRARRVASKRSGLRRRQIFVAFVPKRRELLQQAWHGRAVDHGREGGDQVDAAPMPDVCCKRRSTSAACARVQSRELPTHARDVGSNEGVVTDEPSREADKDRRESRQSWPLCCL